MTRCALVLLTTIPAEQTAVRDVAANHAWSVQLWCFGHLPGRDFAWEYPPGAIPFAAPPLGCASITNYTFHYVMLILALDLTTLVALLALPRGVAAAWTWIALVPLLGPLALARFDVGVCLLFATSFALLTRHPRAAGALLVMAASVKLWPAAVAAPMLRSRDRRKLIQGLLVATSALVGVFWFTGTWFAFVTAWRYQQHRGLQVESLPALPFVWLRAIGLGRLAFRYGSWQVTTTGASPVAAITGIVQLALVAALVLTRRARHLTGKANLGLLAVALVAVMTIADKALSPQYVLWVVIALAVASGLHAPLPRGSFALTAIAALLTHLVYPLLYGQLLAAGTLATIVLTIRNLTLLVLTVRLLQHAAEVASVGRGERPDRFPMPMPHAARRA